MRVFLTVSNIAGVFLFLRHFGGCSNDPIIYRIRDVERESESRGKVAAESVCGGRKAVVGCHERDSLSLAFAALRQVNGFTRVR
jgi:hypothetical protein